MRNLLCHIARKHPAVKTRTTRRGDSATRTKRLNGTTVTIDAITGACPRILPLAGVPAQPACRSCRARTIRPIQQRRSNYPAQPACRSHRPFRPPSSDRHSRLRFARGFRSPGTVSIPGKPAGPVSEGQNGPPLVAAFRRRRRQSRTRGLRSCGNRLREIVPSSSGNR